MNKTRLNRIVKKVKTIIDIPHRVLNTNYQVRENSLNMKTN